MTLKPFQKGEKINIQSNVVEVREDIPVGHKMALTTIEKNADVIKYGYPIGKAKALIQPGGWVHTPNVMTKLGGTLEYSFKPTENKVNQNENKERTFRGYMRANGDAAIRNEIWIINKCH
ncbi:UxaA family hydrolase [Bacillus sp. MRMR6]|uniref:UxaA family hydrolase n=1 Tax=Bacillus sp. MRMR6 TaxID=1928617 RepID=UPI0009516E44|nr:UxaA family hydrolase [Bacillus sp. MRMR6]OLS42180.1 hypothetical protein BTR25_02105 [Bacillus sp. MRMR6]